jgi:hypothetical protein
LHVEKGEHRDCLISVGMWYCFCGSQSNLLSWYPLLISMVIKALWSLKYNQNNDERNQNLQLPPSKTYGINMFASSVDVLIPSSWGDNYICTRAVASSTIHKSTSAVNATDKYFSNILHNWRNHICTCALGGTYTTKKLVCPTQHTVLITRRTCKTHSFCTDLKNYEALWQSTTFCWYMEWPSSRMWRKWEKHSFRRVFRA